MNKAKIRANVPALLFFFLEINKARRTNAADPAEVTYTTEIRNAYIPLKTMKYFPTIEHYEKHVDQVSAVDQMRQALGIAVDKLLDCGFPLKQRIVFDIKRDASNGLDRDYLVNVMIEELDVVPTPEKPHHRVSVTEMADLVTPLLSTSTSHDTL